MYKVFLIVSALTAMVTAEPPVNNYLPPGQLTEASFPSAPSSSYGAPNRPSPQYGAPSAPSSSYGAPSRPSSQYGAPSAPSSSYGAPNRPSPQYNAPRPAPQYNAPSAPSNSYGAPSRPSSSYGAPSGGFNGGGGGYGGGGYDEGPSEPANYEFKYDVDAPDYGTKFGHEEQRQGEVARGKYYVLLPDGRTQTVEYIADQDGYRPTITYSGGNGGNGGGYGRGPSGNGGNGGYQYKK